MHVGWVLHLPPAQTLAGETMLSSRLMNVVLHNGEYQLTSLSLRLLLEYTPALTASCISMKGVTHGQPVKPRKPVVSLHQFREIFGLPFFGFLTSLDGVRVQAD